MAESQPILAPLTPAAIFLVVTINEGGEDRVRDALAEVSGLQRAIGFRVPGADLSCVTSIGSDAWDRLFAGPKPSGLHPFRELKGERHHAPATPGDILFHIRSESMDACFELAGRLVQNLGDAITVLDDTQGFRYFEQRDLLGFVDGTENPTGTAAGEAALVGDEDAEFSGGSYVIIQRYLHPIVEWNELKTEEQEYIVGRTKLGDYELADDVKPADSHVAMTQVSDETGNELQILRHNMPFGSVKDGVYGTYFIGYAATPSVTETMLEQMFLGTADASHDRILDFSTAQTGCLFFAPTIDFLDDLPPAPTQAAEVLDTVDPESDSVPSTPDFSLRIGSLKGDPS
ncbi:Dyp-type peroxidase [Aldersonia kunmingensis]|uniref:Dyp-type peroxidase n=1 Tax=Aldersonia kunmingensis TaxID=408066 RepID=UPI0008376935|nr:Dyp-type peroxidase [Aldersonia kunmingensis]